MATVSGRKWDLETGETEDGATVNVGALVGASAGELVFDGASGDPVTGGKVVRLLLSGGYAGSFRVEDPPAAEVAPPAPEQPAAY